EGTALLRLDDRMARQKLEEAQIAVRMAQADLERAQALQSAAQLEVTRQDELRQRDVGFQRELDKSKMQLRGAEATVKAASVKVEEARAAEKLAQLGLDLTVVRVSTAQQAGKEAATKRRYTILERKVVLGQLIAPPASA